MTYFNQKEIRYIAVRIALLFSVTACIWYCHRPVPAQDFAHSALTRQEFHQAREIVSVRTDSLAALIGKIQETERNAFTVESGGSEWIFRIKDNKAFERVLLDGEPLSNWNSEQRPSLQKLKANAGFSVRVEKLNGISYIRLPAEIMQSIQMAN